jgi:hypothetical protein
MARHLKRFIPLIFFLFPLLLPISCSNSQQILKPICSYATDICRYTTAICSLSVAENSNPASFNDIRAYADSLEQTASMLKTAVAKRTALPESPKP